MPFAWNPTLTYCRRKSAKRSGEFHTAKNPKQQQQPSVRHPPQPNMEIVVSQTGSSRGSIASYLKCDFDDAICIFFFFEIDTTQANTFEMAATAGILFCSENSKLSCVLGDFEIGFHQSPARQFSHPFTCAATAEMTRQSRHRNRSREKTILIFSTLYVCVWVCVGVFSAVGGCLCIFGLMFI